MSEVLRLIYDIADLGELGRLPDGAIVNIGGTIGPNFTVGGKGVLLDDGTSSGGGSGVTLQTAYANSSTPAQMNFSTGKDLILSALNDLKFIFDADTGAVTIEGDLTVLGNSTVIEGTISNLDQVNIRPPNAGTTGLTLRPSAGVTPTVNLLEVAVTNSGPLALSVQPNGTVSAPVLQVNTINGVAIADLLSHIDGLLTPPKHSASQISFDDTGLVNISGSTVQEAIADIDSKLGVIGTSGVVGYEYTQIAPSAIWFINHGGNSVRVQVTIWDETNQAMLADTMTIVDNNQVHIFFASPQAGRAVLMLF